MAILSDMLVIIIIITMQLFLLSHISFATDTMTQSKSLSDGNTLVSNDGTYELGFFSPGSSSNRYVGIWYKNIPVRRVVWVANRDNPIKDNSSKLIISQEGNLLLLNHNQSIVWSTNTTTTTKKSSTLVVQLLNNANLVLKDEKNMNNNEEESFLWQSFDYPTDTLLSGMKYGPNLKKGLKRRLTAWKNWDDPSSGDLSYAMKVTSNPEGIIWKGSIKYSRTGPLTGPQSRAAFGLGLKNNPYYNLTFSNNEQEVYYMYTLKNTSIVALLTVNETLSVRHRLLWAPESNTWSIYQSLPQDSCDVYNACGPNGRCVIDGTPMCQCLDGFKPKSPQQWNIMVWSQGCVRNGNWSCGVKNRDGFHKHVGMRFPDTTNSWTNQNMTIDDCKDICLLNCSCTAYTYLDSETRTGCSIWFGDLNDLRLSQSGQDLFVRIDHASNIDANREHKKIIVLVVSITVSVVLVTLLAISYVSITKAKNRAKINETVWTNENGQSTAEDFELPIFDLATILKATNNFSIDNKLGEGGFGPVYKGTLQDGQVIAVKRLSRSSLQGLNEFKTEVILCAKLQHRNLVKVLGCCIKGEEKMLLYEYMPNKSLDSFLFDPIQRKLLGWSVRFNILKGIARGILYLHQDSRLRIIHRDLKASNILVDYEMNPKISDFGMARMCGGDQIEGKTRRIVGTYGYMAPEYVLGGLFSIKSDVFSFGVLLLETISGKKNSTLTYYERDHNLIWHAWRLWNEGILHELIDDCLKDSCNIPEVLRCIQIGLLCVQHVPNDRPNMTSVLMMLCNENILPQPKEPGFLIQMVSIAENPPHASEKTSTNEVTITRLSAR